MRSPSHGPPNGFTRSADSQGVSDKPLSNRDISRAPMLDARAATRCPMRTHLSIDPPGRLVREPLIGQAELVDPD
jgi:hypothetical protein